MKTKLPWKEFFGSFKSLLPENTVRYESTVPETCMI
jgi:hypothetical protein